MRSTIIIAATVVAFAHSADAATYGGKSKDLPTSFTARLAAVCQSPSLVLTTSAKTACATGAFPRLTAAASAFVNSGTGAELNTLMRQLPLTVAGKSPVPHARPAKLLLAALSHASLRGGWACHRRWRRPAIPSLIPLSVSAASPGATAGSCVSCSPRRRQRIPRPGCAGRAESMRA